MANVGSDPAAVHAPVVSREEIVARRQDLSLVLVDVQPKEIFAREHIPGSINLPVGEIEKRAPALFPDRRKEITVYCAGPT